MEWILALVGGLGIGSLITSIANHFMTRQAATKDRWYQEKREAYLGLLGALHQAAVGPSHENSLAYALWQTRCELFGSTDVSKYAQEMVRTNEGPRSARDEVFRKLIDAMRADLEG
jgi:hypothetical protein